MTTMERKLARFGEGSKLTIAGMNLTGKDGQRKSWRRFSVAEIAHMVAQAMWFSAEDGVSAGGVAAWLGALFPDAAPDRLATEIGRLLVKNGFQPVAHRGDRPNGWAVPAKLDWNDYEDDKSSKTVIRNVPAGPVVTKYACRTCDATFDSKRQRQGHEVGKHFKKGEQMTATPGIEPVVEIPRVKRPTPSVTTLQQAVLEELRANPGRKSTWYADTLGHGRGPTTELLRKLRDHGLAYMQGQGNATIWLPVAPDRIEHVNDQDIKLTWRQQQMLIAVRTHPGLSKFEYAKQVEAKSPDSARKLLERLLAFDLVYTKGNRRSFTYHPVRVHVEAILEPEPVQQKLMSTNGHEKLPELPDEATKGGYVSPDAAAFIIRELETVETDLEALEAKRAQLNEALDKLKA